MSSVQKNIFLEKTETVTTEKIVETDEEFPDTFQETVETYIPEKNIKGYRGYLEHQNAVWIIEDELSINERVEIGFSESPVINSNYEVLFNVLSEYAVKNFEIIITAENDLQCSRLTELLSEIRTELGELIEQKKIRIETLPIKKGFVNKEDKFFLLTDYQIFNKPYRTKLPSAKKYKKSKAKSISSIKRGDYVVHEDYGVGKYTGLETIKIGEVNQESMRIIYNEGGVVYVNLNYLSLVKKYSSSDNLTPTLSTLGSADWANTKQRTKKKIKEAARELIELYAKRKATKGFSFSPDTVWQTELEASFLYDDTPDQSKVTEEVKQDMEAENPMDRLVCGDVGFGKTEIAVRAAFKAVQEGKQAAILVPTTILNEQHYNTFKDRLSQFPVKIASLSRFRSKKEQTQIIKELQTGGVDIVIGTHRLLSKDVQFKDLGLLIIDEEHRFGVSAKEKLRSFKVNVDTLTLTATPIPRTLNLSLLGARDLSIIATPPPNRQPIYTYVSVFNITKMREWIMNEINRNGQIYFVHDRVHSIDKLAAYLTKHIPEIKIGVAHGQMKPAQLEDVIHRFLNREFNLLLSTKIIESGLDIPNVNTIIINRADRFGLAELHQLRGRVGRSDKQAFAYFIVPSMDGINKKALKRLQAIEEYTDIGAGFNISMRDLEIRGAGNLLGTEQSGFINEVGFDLYIKLINEAVEELKCQEFKDIFKDLPQPEARTEPTVDTYFEIGIPAEYIPEQMDRLNFYTFLYSIKNAGEIEEIQEEIIDRFGPVPEKVKRLIATALLKFYASYALFERVIIQQKNIFIILPKGQKEDYYKEKFIPVMEYIMSRYKNNIKFSQQKEVLKLVIPNTFSTPEKVLEFLVKFSREVINVISPSRKG
jgi:transcription-repair coupling factor (superfamily II helicase)